jgi:hypothetical protein
MTLYYLRKEKWFLAGLSGLLAALSKNQGILLIIPAIMEYSMVIMAFKKAKNQTYRQVITLFFAKTFYLLLIPFGFFLYLLLNKWIAGDWFRFLKYQKEHWISKFGYIVDNLQSITISALTPTDQLHFNNILTLATFVFFIIVTAYSLNKIRTSYIAYMIIFIIISYSPTWLLSGPSYLSSLIPVYIALAVFTAKREVDVIVTYSFTLLLGFLMMMYLLGRFF